MQDVVASYFRVKDWMPSTTDGVDLLSSHTMACLPLTTITAPISKVATLPVVSTRKYWHWVTEQDTHPYENTSNCYLKYLPHYISNPGDYATES